MRGIKLSRSFLFWHHLTLVKIVIDQGGCSDGLTDYGLHLHHLNFVHPYYSNRSEFTGEVGWQRQPWRSR